MVEFFGEIFSKEVILGIVVTGICVICLVLIFSSIKKNFKAKVRKISSKCKELQTVNDTYHFWDDMDSEYSCSRRLKTKQQFDRFDFNNYFEEVIERNLEDIEEIIDQTKGNRIWLKQYKIDVENIVVTTTKEQVKGSGIPYFIFRKLEDKIFEEEKIKPVVNPVFICEASYASPQGRNYYEDIVTYSFNELIYHHKIVIDKMEARKTKAYQRKLMTDSLRYDILKRDGFRCVLCGRTAKDGEKLQVDHIIPVSKGGKTMKSNLRTLCRTCNLGKSDKYDESGDN